MAQGPDLTLNRVKKSPKLKKATYRASDFLSKEQQTELKKANIAGKKKKRRLFDAVDAFAAEVLARFGWETYTQWQNGAIEQQKMERYIAAERAREAQSRLPLEGIVDALVMDCIRRHKGDPVPKGPKLASKWLKDEYKVARGEY